MTFQEIVYSVGGARSKDAYECLAAVDTEQLTSDEKALLTVLLRSFERKGQFVSRKYLSGKFGKHTPSCPNIADFDAELSAFVERRALQNVSLDLQEATASSQSLPELQEAVSRVIEKNPGSDVVLHDDIANIGDLYDQSVKFQNTYMSGIPAIDELTSGFGEGLVSSVVAWTSHGKSAFWVNAAYKNAKLGKITALVSLEIPTQIVYYQLLSRASYDTEMEIPYEKIVRRMLTDDEKKHLFGTVKSNFEKLPGSIHVLDSGYFHTWTGPEIKRLLRKVEKFRGGLDYVIVDHVNLFRYINPKIEGDFYIKAFGDLATSYKTLNDKLIGVGFAVQANRQGWKAAVNNAGRYNMLAVAEFREIERTSTYVTFLYADEIMRAQKEAKIQLQKHRLGRIMEDPEITQVYYPCSVFGLDHADVSCRVKPGSNLSSAMSDLFSGDDGGTNGEEISDFDM